ncbi:MAG: hypothetical protein HYZ44_17875 [Bacteroidetes bacterium]|nr:hypothetical protein [Bacteroidota bacterium]
MKDLIKKLTIDKDYVFAGQRKDLINILQDTQVVNFKLIDHAEIKLYPDISWGTMVFKGGLTGLQVDGINVRAKTSTVGTDRLKINFRTRIRPEHYFIIGLFIFFFIGTIFSKEKPGWTFLFLFGLWIICHSWLQFIYRSQENNLIEKLVKKLRLEKM